MKMKRWVFPALIAIVATIQAHRFANNIVQPERLAGRSGQATKRPKNVVIMIGDGMGLTQVTAGLYSNNNRLHLERCPVTGMIATNSAKQLITDSAAGATAFSCGCKTYNGAIGVTKDRKRCVTLFEQADSAGLATGVVVSCSVTHATPACFVAHADERAEVEKIAAFFLQNRVDFLVGGGLKYFNKRTIDQRNLYEEMRVAGYDISNFAEKRLSDAQPDPARPFAWFSADKEPAPANAGRDYLAPAAAMAADFLKKRSDKGFILLVEGSQIDWACHDNDAPRAIDEMLDFDKTIGEILRFAETDGETLVVITADHETGGMAILQGSEMDSLNISFTSKGHTAAFVPVFAYGPGAEQFSGVYDNTDIHRKLHALLGFPPVWPVENENGKKKKK